MQSFVKLLSARFLFTAAVQMQAIMLGWRMYELTHDPLHLGLIGLAEAVPSLGLALWAGYIVDRSHPITAYRGCILVSLCSSLIFVGSQWPGLDLTTTAQVTALYASSLVTGLARSFSQPSIYAAVPNLVPRQMLPRAAAWMATTMQVARIGGPAVGGVLFGFLGVFLTTLVVCVLLLLAGLVALWVPRFARPAGPPPAAFSWAELLAGGRFVFTHPILLPALSLDMLSVLFGGVTALLPIFASDILLVGREGLGLLRAAPAVGAAITSIVMTRLDLGEGSGKLLLGAVGGFGLCIIVFGLSHNTALSVAALGLSGAFDSVSMVIRGAAVQLESPEALRGRISAVNSIFIGSSNELGELESGLAAAAFGTIPTVLGGGVICLLVVTTFWFVCPALRQLNLQRAPS